MIDAGLKMCYIINKDLSNWFKDNLFEYDFEKIIFLKTLFNS